VAVQSLKAQPLRLQFRVLERVFERSFVEPETRVADDHRKGSEVKAKDNHLSIALGGTYLFIYLLL
jgi:hypothetical protein